MNQDDIHIRKELGAAYGLRVFSTTHDRSIHIDRVNVQWKLFAVLILQKKHKDRLF